MGKLIKSLLIKICNHQTVSLSLVITPFFFKKNLLRNYLNLRKLNLIENVKKVCCKLKLLACPKIAGRKGRKNLIAFIIQLRQNTVDIL